MTNPFTSRAAVVVLFAFAAGSLAAAQESGAVAPVGAPLSDSGEFYGTTVAQVRVVPAAAFRPSSSTTLWQLSGSSTTPSRLATQPLSPRNDYFATLDLPSGLRLSGMRIYYSDYDPTVNLSVDLLRAPGVGPLTVVGSVASSLAAGDGEASVAINHLVDNSGSSQLLLRLTLPIGVAGPLQFREAMLTWKRELKEHGGPETFIDVFLTDDEFHHIEAMWEAGITGGCTMPPVPLAYCPASVVTRGQMAVFLGRALGFYWPF